MKRLLIALLTTVPLFAMALKNYNIEIINLSPNTLTFTPTKYSCLINEEEPGEFKVMPNNASKAERKDYVYKRCEKNGGDIALAYDISDDKGGTLNIVFAVTRDGLKYTTIIQRNGQGILDMQSAMCSADGSKPVACDFWPGYNKLEVYNPDTMTAVVTIK